MPGTPPQTPYLGIPRPADTDTAQFSAQVNAISDTIDAASALLRPGDLVVSAATTRAGCLLCDGSAVSRTTYAALYAAIATTYGAGDGSSTFNVPDYRGRTIIGADPTGVHLPVAMPALGASGGEERHTLSAAEMPVHSHAPSSNGYPVAAAPGGQTFNLFGAAAGTNATVSTTGGSISNDSATGNAGSGSAHNNLQPYATANVFIKT